MKRVLFAALVIAALLLSLVGTVAAAPPADNPGKGPPEFAKVVFIHYEKGFAPARSSGSEADGYIYSGYHWFDREIPVDYLINLTGSGDNGTFSSGIEAAFQTWEDDPGSYIDFAFTGIDNDIGISSLAGEMDFNNVVGWANLSDYEYGEGVIAVTIFWYQIGNLRLAEVDVAMNTNGYHWSQSDPGEIWTAGDDPQAYDVDVQNIMTHEAGHWLVLDDLYDAGLNSEKTMYGLADEFELKSRSLDPRDEAGINAIYPSTEEAPSGGDGDIEIFNFYFSPQDFTTIEDSVTWINRQGSHDVTFHIDGVELNSGRLGEGETWTVFKGDFLELDPNFDFSQPIHYHCHKHTKGQRVMEGTITFE